MKSFVNVSILIWSLFCCAGFAQSPRYDVFINVQNQSIAERQNAARAALEQILIRLTQNPNLKNEKVFATALDKADSYLEEFSYSPHEEDDFYTLKMKFDQKSILNFLKGGTVNFGPNEQPPIIVWSKLKNNQGALEFLNNDSVSLAHDAFVASAKKHNINVIFPLLDINELSQLNSDKNLNLDTEKLQKLSNRYGAHTILIGTLTQQSEGYNGEWTLVLGDKKIDLHISNTDLSSMIDEVIDQTNTKSKANNPLMSMVTSDWVTLVVDNVGDKEELNNILIALKNIDEIDDVRINSLNADIVELSVLVRSDIINFEKNILKEKRLLLKYSAKRDKKLYYSWLP